MKLLLIMSLISVAAYGMDPETYKAMQPISVPGGKHELQKGEWRPVKPAPLESTKTLVELEREKSELNSQITKLNKEMEALKTPVRSRGEHVSGRRGEGDTDKMRNLVKRRDSAERKLRDVEQLIARKQK